MKNLNDIIGNRTRDLPACNPVPQPTAPPRAAPISITTPLSMYLLACRLSVSLFLIKVCL